jgi:hypothetical protein
MSSTFGVRGSLTSCKRGHKSKAFTSDKYIKKPNQNIKN